VTSELSAEYLTSLVRELLSLPRETEWVEFKHNVADPEEVGEYISALSNSAALAGKAFAYLVWGVEDRSHHIVGTSFSPRSTKVGNEELENWLLHLLTPKIDFRFFQTAVDDRPIVVLQIQRAFRHPVQFRGSDYIRVGTYKKRLKDHQEKEAGLWRAFDQTPFEDLASVEHVSADEALRLLDYPAYFDLLELPLPENRDGILSALASDNVIRRGSAGGWDVTNLGAVLLAKHLSEFGGLKRKAVRVIQYRGRDRVDTLKEQVGVKGYACGFEGLIGYVNGLLPSNEVIEQALRKSVPMFPELAVRELLVNALIHQDLFVTGAGPTVEIFDDRIEITNPGRPLVDTKRFVDTPPRSRNEALASLMRRFRICEERGSGIDKVVFQVEFFQLPAPLFEVPDEFTRTVLFAHRPLARMDKGERVRACYLHACLKYVSRNYLTNSSLRQRFGIAPQNIALASRLIREAVGEGAIMPFDDAAAPKLMKYVPFWAKGSDAEQRT
jgi:predicted HTH transcriptional regulator